jgi:hypothetical protein
MEAFRYVTYGIANTKEGEMFITQYSLHLRKEGNIKRKCYYEITKENDQEQMDFFDIVIAEYHLEKPLMA